MGRHLVRVQILRMLNFLLLHGKRGAGRKGTDAARLWLVSTRFAH